MGICRLLPEKKSLYFYAEGADSPHFHCIESLKADVFNLLITENLTVTLNSSLLHTLSMAANVKLPPTLADLCLSQT